VVAQICLGQIGGVFFFQDPMDAHNPHACDIECLNRQGNVYNIIMCPNPTAAKTVVVAMEMALKEGRQDWIPSFFEDLESPSDTRSDKR
jgi:methylglyoxal synthase